MERSTRVYLFGDQTNSFDAGLRRLLQIKDNGSLTSFLERTRYALQLEIGHLPVFERQLFPRFTSVLDLLARYRESGNHPALESTFTCIHQLAAFIRYTAVLSHHYRDANLKAVITALEYKHILCLLRPTWLACVLALWQQQQ